MSIIFHIIHVDHNVACRIYFGSRVKSFRKYGGEAATNGNESPACYANHLKKKVQTCVSRPDAAVGMTPEEAGRGPARGQSRLTTMELQQNPRCLPACVPVSREAGAGPLKAKNKKTNKKTAGWDLCTYVQRLRG